MEDIAAGLQDNHHNHMLIFPGNECKGRKTYIVHFKDRQQSMMAVFVFLWLLPEFLRYNNILYII